MSSLDDAEKAEAVAKWDRRWLKFLKEVTEGELHKPAA